MARSAMVRLLLFALGIALLTLSSFDRAAAAGFRDEFDASELGARWSWENPGQSSSYALYGVFHLFVGPGSDQWLGRDAAPRLLKRQPSRVWTIETAVTFNTGGAHTFTGLTLFADAGNWLVWGQTGNASLEASGIVNFEPTGPIGVMATKYPYLRLRRVDNLYFFDASPDGVHWANANVYEDRTRAFADARIGILGKDWSHGGGGYGVAYEYFSENGQYQVPAVLVGSTARIGQQTGPASVNFTQAVDVCGTDYGIMFDWLDRTYVAYGETQACSAAGAGPKSQTMAYTSDRRPADGLTLDGWITDRNGRAKELFPETEAGGFASIPTGAIATGENAYLFYMRVMGWAAQPGQWYCDRASIASAHASDQAAWTDHSATIAWGRGAFNQLAVLREGSTLYIYGVPCGRFGSIKLMKVNDASVLDKSAYRYFAGFEGDRPRWSVAESAAVTVAGGPAGELSVRYNAYLGRYIMTYLDTRKEAIVMRESPLPWGSWSAPTVVARNAQFPQLYAPFMKPGFDENGGETIYYTMSQFGPYNVFWMRTTLIRAP